MIQLRAALKKSFGDRGLVRTLLDYLLRFGLSKPGHHDRRSERNKARENAPRPARMSNASHETPVVRRCGKRPDGCGNGDDERATRPSGRCELIDPRRLLLEQRKRQSMRNFTMRIELHPRLASWTLALLACLTCRPGWAEEPASHGDDEQAIRRQAQKYLAAIESGDAEKIASFWTAKGDYVDDAGRAARGRELARQAGDRAAAAEAAQQFAATVESIRFITPKVAIEDGVHRLSAAAGVSLVRRYTAVWVKQDGQWLLDSVRELAARADAPRNRLEALSWMLGDWVSEDGKTLRLSCRWSDDQHFLLREIEVASSDRGPLRVTQRIGWDAHEKQIKSWTFDSQGGHGDGLWFRQGDRWIVEAAIVLPDGRVATGANVYVRQGDDAFVWESNHAEIDGEPQPSRKLRLVRKANPKKTSN